jgi:uncharacterized protein YecE (DUF72 family)
MTTGMQIQMALRIGTSGWNYRHWRGRFYPDDLPAHGWFKHYCEAFDTVEINNTFYHLPTEATFDGWRDQAPKGFLYAVKANRFITHMKKLKDPEEPLELFLGRARRLGAHLGPILYQLPPRWKPNLERLEKFCEQLPDDLTHVIEFREPDWLKEETYRILAQYRVCLCIHDLIRDHPRRITGKATYVRFHGAGTKYGGSYSDSALQRWAGWMREAAEESHEVYAYFNNDSNAYAVANAQALHEILGVG